MAQAKALVEIHAERITERVAQQVQYSRPDKKKKKKKAEQTR